MSNPQDMIDVAEIDTYVGTEDDIGAREWIMIRFYPLSKSGTITFEHHYVLSNGSRGVWNDSGMSFDVKDLDTVIDALKRIRDMAKP